MALRFSTSFAVAAVATSALLLSSATAASVPFGRCGPPALVVWLDTHPGHAMGSAYYGLEFTNRSTRSCSLFGYPGVSAVTARGARIGRAAARNPAYEPLLVVLPSGATATAMLQVVNASNFPPTVCRARIAAGLRVYPPGWRASRLVPFPFSACSGSGPTFLTVQAVQPST